MKTTNIIFICSVILFLSCDKGSLVAPELTLPQNGSTSIWPPITFSWEAISDATSYEIEARWSYHGENGDYLIKSGIINNSYTDNSFDNVWDGRTVYWRVRAVNKSKTGPWSGEWAFELNDDYN